MPITSQLTAARKRLKRATKTTDRHRTTVCDLPEHIIGDILTRVPAWTVACTLTLCRTIRSSVADEEHFARTQFTRSSKTLGLFYPPKFDLITGGVMHLLDDHINGGRISARKSTVGEFSSENFPNGAVEVKGSCNGLLLCLRRNYANLDDAFFVCNPLRRSRWVKLPRPSVRSAYEAGSDYGFGFCPETDLYKVFRIVPILGPEGVCVIGCEVLRVGSGQWRAAPFNGSSRQFIHHNMHRPSPLIAFNGSLHGLFTTARVHNGEDLFVSRFKVHEEELSSLVPVPVRNHDDYSVTLVVLWDQLTVFSASKYGPEIEIWAMTEYGVRESWVKRWVIGSDILKGMEATWLKPIKIREDGELLMWYMDHTGFSWVCYHPERSKFKRHKLRGIEQCERVDYTPSFLSPRDVARGAH